MSSVHDLYIDDSNRVDPKVFGDMVELVHRNGGQIVTVPGKPLHQLKIDQEIDYRGERRVIKAFQGYNNEIVVLNSLDNMSSLSVGYSKLLERTWFDERYDSYTPVELIARGAPLPDTVQCVLCSKTLHKMQDSILWVSSNHKTPCCMSCSKGK